MISGFVIRERSCPRCGIRRTARLGTTDLAFCFNCHHQWSHGLRDTGLSPSVQSFLDQLFSSRIND